MSVLRFNLNSAKAYVITMAVTHDVLGTPTLPVPESNTELGHFHHLDVADVAGTLAVFIPICGIADVLQSPP